MTASRLKHHRLWLVFGLLLVGLVIYLTLTPTPPDLELGIRIWDKFSHFLAYFVLMSWFVQIYHKKRTRFRLMLCLILLGITLEILQSLGGTRTMEIADMIANSIGVLAGWLLGQTRLAFVLLRVEKLLFKHVA